MERLISLFGLVILMLLAWGMSSDRRRVPYRLIIGGIGLQFALAALILWTRPGLWFFDGIGVFFNKMLSFVDAGASFVFDIHPRPGESALPPKFLLLRSFAFGVLPTIIFFSAFMSVLYYLGVMQRIVVAMAWLMQKTLRTSGAESLAAAANVFVGHTEAPLVVRPYIDGMTLSELNALMIGGFATISGGLLAVYAGMGIHPGHLMTASVISAPAALLVAKLMLPELDTPQTAGNVRLTHERRGVNVIEAAAIGTTEGLQLALNVAAMLIAFLALIAMLDAILGWAGNQMHAAAAFLGWVPPESTWHWSLEKGLGILFAPLAWIMGIEARDCPRAGELLGIKMVANEFLAYSQLGAWIRDADPALSLSVRSQYILTYALSGFSNFGAIGIQLGGIGALAPSRRPDLARLGLRAMLGGTIACCMTACVAGVLIPESPVIHTAGG